MAVIAHYKFNEDTASDNDELVTNGSAPSDLTGWTQTPGTQWSIVGNKFQGAGDSANNFLTQDFGVAVGRKYKFSYDVTANSLVGGISDNQIGLSGVGTFGLTTLSSDVATHTYYLSSIQSTTSNNDLRILLASRVTGGTIDIDNISIQLLAVVDSSGNGHDGIAQQDTNTIHRAGKINGAFDFTPNDYILIPDHDDFTPARTPFSVSAWVYMDDAINFYIASKGKYNVDGEWRFGTKADKHFCCRVFDENVNNCYLGREYTTALAEDVWLHLCFTYGGGNTSASCKLYQNGVRVDNANHQASATSFNTVQASGHDVWLGRNPDNYYANGLIDNIVFFNQELTIDEIKILHSAGHGTEIMADLDESRRIQRRPIWQR